MRQPTDSNDDVAVDVLVVGAGPAGFMAALTVCLIPAPLSRFEMAFMSGVLTRELKSYA